MIGEKETIHLAWCHNGMVDGNFMVSIIDVLGAYSKRFGSYNTVQVSGLISRGRNMLVDHFLRNTKDDWLFMVDADQFFTVDGVGKLIESANAETHPIVSGLVFTLRNSVTLESTPLIYGSNDGSVSFMTDYPKDSLIPVAGASAGSLLIHRSVLLKIQEMFKDKTGPSWAWFADGAMSDDRWMGEDVLFSLRVYEAGFQMHAHTGALFPHHKQIWLQETHYEQWLESVRNGTD
jgi:hypothetical protein